MAQVFLDKLNTFWMCSVWLACRSFGICPFTKIVNGNLPVRLRWKVRVVYIYACVRARSLQWCLTLCNPMDCSPPGSSVHGILQTRILEWVAMPFSRGSSRPRDQTHVSYVSCIADSFFTVWAIREALHNTYTYIHTVALVVKNPPVNAGDPGSIKILQEK